MKEQAYQSKIYKWYFAVGGHCVNGKYTKAGEADLQGSVPIHAGIRPEDSLAENKTITVRTILVSLLVEVKTKLDYDRVMRGVKEVDNRYIIENLTPLKEHEPLQIHKINEVRAKGGLALIAYSVEQVEQYLVAQGVWKSRP